MSLPPPPSFSLPRVQHNGTSPHLQADTLQQQQQQQQLLQLPRLQLGNAGEPQNSSSYPAVCGLLPPLDAPSDPPKVTCGTLGSCESDDTPQHQLSRTPTATAASAAQQQHSAAQHSAAVAKGGLVQRPGGTIITVALPAALPGNSSSMGLAAGLPVTATSPAAAGGLPRLQPAAAAGSGAPAPTGLAPGQGLINMPPAFLIPAAAVGPQGAHHPAAAAAAAAAAMAAARTAGSILSGPAALGVPIKPEGDSSNGALGGFAGSSSTSNSNGQWCRRGLSSRGPCFHCGTTYSSQWRSGPPHKPVLCNACGLYYRKVQSLPDHTCEVAGALEVSTRQ